MLKNKENTSPDGVSGGEITQSQGTELNNDETQAKPGENSEFSENGSDSSKPVIAGTSQGLNFSCLSDHSKLGVSDDHKSLIKGKSVVSEDHHDHNLDENRWVERDFLQLSGRSSKREVEDDQIHVMSRDKKPKLETLDLSLSLSDTSLSLSTSNRVQFQNGDPSVNNTQTTFSNDFSAPLSYSYSHQFSHNPSCSMTRNSTENYEIWNGGEGTNGSVHSRFRPIADGGVALVQGNRTISDNNLSLFERCKNINCKRLLPVDGCECKICSKTKGFCSECMCPICLNFDCANNTCSWVGCDVCSHWCHVACGLQNNIIKPGPNLNDPVQFHCLGCGHASEMFGFIKDAFKSCARQWSRETLTKELDCVRKIFKGSSDFKGKELHIKASEMISRLDNKIMSPEDVCNFIIHFFNYTDDVSELATSNLPSTITPLKRDPQNSIKLPTQLIEDEWSVKSSKKYNFDDVESLMRVKEVEARMFQQKADEARKEAEGYKRMIRVNIEKLDEEYGEKIGKLCLTECEERKKKKVVEFKVLENDRCEYYKLKMKMQADIAGLLQRMEYTKKLCV